VEKIIKKIRKSGAGAKKGFGKIIWIFELERMWKTA
jgi:hypothetical protein